MDETGKILELAESYKDYTAANLSSLVKIKSLSCGEKAVNAELKKQMKKAGFDKVWFDGLGNVIGKIGKGGKVIAFDAHMDTVDTGNKANWTFDPFSGAVKDGYVHGRGTVDQKGGAAAFVTAGRILSEIGLPDNVSVLCVGSVIEEDCDGLCWKYIVEEEKIRPDLVVSTEPTDLNLYRGQRGRMEIEVSFHGISAHGSSPERGRNAVYMASRFCLEVEKLNKRLKKDDFLGKGSVTVSEFVSGSPSLCAVADFSKIHLDRRLTIGETKNTALAQIQDITAEDRAEVTLSDYMATAWTGLEYGMEKYYPTWVLEETHPAVQLGSDAYRKLYGKQPLIDKWTFSTNGVTINGIYGIPVIGFGPGRESLAHSPDEKTAVSDLVAASAFYARLVLDFAAR